VACGDIIPTLDQVESWSPPPPPPPDWSSFVTSVKMGYRQINNAKKHWVDAIDTYHQSGMTIREGTVNARALFETILAAKNP